MRVIVYEPSYNDKHCDILRSFAAGIPDAVVRKATDFIPGDGDIGVVFGWYKNAYAPTMAKKPIIEHYRALGRHRLIVVESGFQLRGEYYQIGWDGFAGNADFVPSDVSRDRWDAMPIRSKPWRDQKPGNTVVIGQLPRDTQVQDVDHARWCRETMAKCVDLFGFRSGRVLFRPHPRCNEPEIYGIDQYSMDTGKLEDTLKAAERVVTWNSTTGVDAILAGVPVVAMDRGAMVWSIASHSLEDPLVYPDRKQWLASLGYSQWTLPEMAEGLPWQHLTR